MGKHRAYLRGLQCNWRVVVASTGLLAVLLVTFLLTVFYLWDPPSSSNKLRRNSQNKVSRPLFIYRMHYLIRLIRDYCNSGRYTGSTL